MHRTRAALLIVFLIITVIGTAAYTRTLHDKQPHDSITLRNSDKKELAMKLVSSAENSSLDWKAQYGFIEDIDDNRGYTGGLIGFTSGTGDMLELVRYYTKLKPGNNLAQYLPALQQVNGSASHDGLDPNFVKDWKSAAKDPAFQKAQDYERDKIYFDPAVDLGLKDGLHTLGQFIYYDAFVVHGPGNDPNGFYAIRKEAMQKARTPQQGGDEREYLKAFLDIRDKVMKREPAHKDTSRIDTAQRWFLNDNNLDLMPPLHWETYGDSYDIK